MHAGRYTVAIGAAGSLATLADLGHSYWAMVAAAAPIAAADATRGPVRAVHRTVGTYGGVLLTACLLTVDWSPLQLAVLLAALQFIGEVFVIRHYSVALVFMTPVALLMTEFVAAKPTSVWLQPARWKRPSAPALRRNHRPPIGSFSRRSRTATRLGVPVTAPEAGLGRGSGLPRPGWMLVVLVCRTPHRCTCQATPQEAICPLQT